MKQRILVVDDEPPMLKLLAHVLSDRTPYLVTTESNSLEVPRILEKEEYDLIITDLGMPGLDGMQILKMVREQDRFEEVVIITAFGSLATVLEALSERVFDFLVKPFRKSQIAAVVERAMRHQREKRQDMELRRICGLEPYAEAERTFRIEYLRRLAASAGGDTEAVARRAGLGPDVLASLDEELKTGSKENEE
jgi:DNA-binding NtrC family response regulator